MWKHVVSATACESITSQAPRERKWRIAAVTAYLIHARRQVQDDYCIESLCSVTQMKDNSKKNVGFVHKWVTFITSDTNKHQQPKLCRSYKCNSKQLISPKVQIWRYMVWLYYRRCWHSFIFFSLTQQIPSNWTWLGNFFPPWLLQIHWSTNWIKCVFLLFLFFFS